MASVGQADKSPKKAELPPRERILAAARDLFYARGIRAVSVDEIAAAAQTNKMTLYRHFESKDLLVAEYLRSVAAEVDAVADEAERANPGNPAGQLDTWIAMVGEELGTLDDRGCPMANAAVELPEKEHPARAVIEDFKTRQCERLIALCRTAGLVEPERLASGLFLLFEGACVSIQSVGRDGPGNRFVEMARALIASHKPGGT